jgi:hypothetical protein
MSDAALSIARAQKADAARQAMGTVALADWLEDVLTAMHASIASALGIPPETLPLLPPLPPQVENLRKRALERNRQEELDAVTDAISRRKLAALRAPKEPMRHNYDEEASHDGTTWGKNAERDKLLAGGQAAKHAAMAKLGEFVGDGSDAHMASRPVREEIYRRLAEEAKK